MSAPTPVLTTLRQGVATALRAIAAGSTYHTTLTGDDQVVAGLYANPPRTGSPCVMVGAPTWSSEHGQQLGAYTRKLQLRLVCWAPTGTDTTDAKMTAIEKLTQDVTIAVETAINYEIGRAHV